LIVDERKGIGLILDVCVAECAVLTSAGTSRPECASEEGTARKNIGACDVEQKACTVLHHARTSLATPRRERRTRKGLPKGSLAPSSPSAWNAGPAAKNQESPSARLGFYVLSDFVHTVKKQNVLDNDTSRNGSRRKERNMLIKLYRKGKEMGKRIRKINTVIKRLKEPQHISMMHVGQGAGLVPRALDLDGVAGMIQPALVDATEAKISGRADGEDKEMEEVVRGAVHEYERKKEEMIGKMAAIRDQQMEMRKRIMKATKREPVNMGSK
jgi:hypothetical protein